MPQGLLYSAGITGTGASLPPKVMTNQELEKIVDTTDEWIRSRTGIHERRIAEKGVATSDLAAEAGKMALKNAGLDPAELDLILVCTITPDMTFPSTACFVQDKIGAYNAAAFDLAAGCSGFVYGLTVATQFIETGLYKNILVIGAEILSRFLNWEDRGTCVLFGDGAGAVVMSRVEKGYGVLAVELGADGSGADHLKLPYGGSLNPINRENCESPDRYLTMAGSEVFKFAVRIMGEAAANVIKKVGLNQEQIDWFIPHQANIRIIEAAARRLELPMDRVYVNLHKYGNTSAASIPIALHEAVTEGRIKKDDNLVLVGFGTGLTWASCVIKWIL